MSEPKTTREMLEDLCLRFRSSISLIDLLGLWEKLPEGEKKWGYDLLLEYQYLARSGPDFFNDEGGYEEWLLWCDDMKERRLAFFGSLYEETYHARYLFRKNYRNATTDIGFSWVAISELILHFRRLIAGTPRAVRLLQLNLDLEKTPEKWPSGSSMSCRSSRKMSLHHLDRDFS
jgi:hypothetical protein